MSRNYGIEIECTNITESRALEVLNQAGINVTSSGYHRADYSKWNVSPDISISYGCEIISPILNGESGLEEIKRVCKALSDAGATVNKTCGLHVHVDANGLTGPWVRSIVTRYAKFESTIDSFMPVSRRDNNNSRYISSIIPVVGYVSSSPNWLSNSVETVCSTMSNRYQKVNLASYSRTRTIEFRHHSGSVNGNKVTNWVQFVLAFVEASNPSLLAPVSTESDSPVQRRRGRPPRINSNQSDTIYENGTPVQANEYSLSNRKAREIYRLLAGHLNVYMSVSSISQSIGIDSVSVPSYISMIRNQLGVEIKNSRHFGYKLISTNVVRAPVVNTTRTINRPVPTPVSIDFPNDEWTRGIPADLVSFYTERMMELNSQS